jgi:aryl-alcohol dehydrogenase-like predicted oxidoreductase/NAD-dependent dihydropyrimidine dehydrogenase PreA subunit
VKQNVLGNTGIQVSELALGTLTFAKMQAGLSIEEGGRVIRKAIELGINFMDSATTYGTQVHVGEGIKGAKEKIIVSTKSHGMTLEAVKKDFEASLRELGRDYIDVYQFHLIDGSADLAARQEALDFLLDCKRRGLIRAIGASVHKIEGARAVVGEPRIDVLFPILNYRGLGIKDGSIDDMIEVCRQADARGMGVMAMKPLGGGHLRKSPKDAFKFLKQLGIVDSVCTGMKSVAEVEMNVRLLEGRTVPKKILSQVETVAPRLIVSPFCKGCGTCVGACAQEALSVDYAQADPAKEKKGHAVVDDDTCILCGYCAEACPHFAIRVV